MSDPQQYLIITLVSLMLSAFFSGTEIAYISANKLKIEIERKKNLFRSRALGMLMSNPSQFISTMLIGNNLVLVMYSSFLALLLQGFLEPVIHSSWGLLLVETLISTVIVLIFGEFLPKMVGNASPNKMLVSFSWLTALFYIVLYPVALLTTGLSKCVLRIFGGGKDDANNEESEFDRLDLDNLIVQNTPGESAAPAAKHGAKMLRNALEFRDITVRECIVPRNELACVEVNAPISELAHKFTQTGFSRILVYDDNIDNIIGFVHTGDMFRSPGSIRSVLHTMPIVPESMPASKLLGKLIKQHKGIALVVDEFGGTCGISTMEDILEEIIGEIQDEHDKTSFEEKRVEKNRFLFSGRLEIDHLNEKYGLDLPESEQYETLAGYIISCLRQIPRSGEEFDLGPHHFKIVRATGTQIVSVELTVAS